MTNTHTNTHTDKYKYTQYKYRAGSGLYSSKSPGAVVEDNAVSQE